MIYSKQNNCMNKTLSPKWGSCALYNFLKKEKLFGGIYQIFSPIDLLVEKHVVTAKGQSFAKE